MEELEEEEEPEEQEAAGQGATNPPDQNPLRLRPGS